MSGHRGGGWRRHAMMKLQCATRDVAIGRQDRALGLEVPLHLQQLADEVIE